MTMAYEDGPVLLVEDDEILRDATVQALELSGLVVEAYESATRAARNLTPGFAGCVVTDIRMAGMDGLQLFARTRELDPEIPVVLMTGHGDIEMAVRTMHDGAFDFLAKPFATEHLVAVVRKALQTRRLVLDNRALRKAVSVAASEPVSQSRVMERLRTSISQIAQTNIDVQIEGEPGSGKEFWARQLHRQSNRYEQPFVSRSAERLLAESDLPTIEQSCHGGTLYLEDCEALRETGQARLAALLDERERRSLECPAESGFRLIVATRDTPASVPLSEALSHRIGSIKLRVPPLRERREDIPALFARFVREALDQTGRKKFDLNAADRKRLLEHDWPGNFRELRNFAFSAVLNLPRQALEVASHGAQKDLSARVGSYEKMLIVEALEATRGNVVQTCALLGTPRKTLYEKFARHGIDPARFRSSSVIGRR